MTQVRDHCPDCGHKLHPQEMATLFRGGKLECWYCEAPLKAQPKFSLEYIGQTSVAGWALVDTLVTGGDAGWWTMAAAVAIIAAVKVLPPGLVAGAPWVEVVSTRAGNSAAEARTG